MKDRFYCDKGLNIVLPRCRFDFSIPRWYQTSTAFYVAMLAINMLALSIIVAINLLNR